MKTYRRERFESLIQEELDKLLVKEIDFKQGTLVTLTSVDVSSDLANAKVGVSVIPGSASKEALEVLGKRCGKLQYLLNRKLNVRPMPRIEFVVDRGLENAAEVEKLLLKQ